VQEHPHDGDAGGEPDGDNWARELLKRREERESERQEREEDLPIELREFLYRRA
jgi:hypothetical protein